MTNDVPRQRFKKELIRVGTYVKDKEGSKLRVTALLLENWVKQFRRMQTNGVVVPVPANHTNDARATMGAVIDLYVDGKSLFGILELIGADAINMAYRNDVSIFSPPEFTDGKGNHYLRPIVHVALTPHPVVPGLSGFEPIAVSFQGGHKMTAHDMLLADASLRAQKALGPDSAWGLARKQKGEQDDETPNW